MNIFEITIQRKLGDAWPVVVEHSRPDALSPVRKEGSLQLDLTELLKQPAPLDYGVVLGQALFRDRVHEAFAGALRESEDNLRVLLFVEAEDLKTLRWERLCAEFDDDWDFLALVQRTPFSLYLPSVTDRRFPPIGRHALRALVVVASPEGLERYGLEHFDVEAAISSVRMALGDIPNDVLAVCGDAAGLPALDVLAQRITEEPYTLLHFVCHGHFDRQTGDTSLFLADIYNQVDRVGGARLLKRLRKLRGARGLPHFTFLATCESAAPEAEGSLGGLAQRLVRELGMPAVVAMTDRVSIPTAQTLAERFYRELWKHGEVDRALVEATAGLAERYDITVPALYSRLGGQPLFSDKLDRVPSHEESRLGLERFGSLLEERAPVLRPQLQEHVTILRRTLGISKEVLGEEERGEREQATAELNNLCREVLDITFNALALRVKPPDYDSRCPFPGLLAFQADDREFFFGREKLVEQLTGRLAEHNLLPILGPSGCGKSSLVLAGLVPALQEQKPSLKMAYMTPGSDPLAQLETSLGRAQGQPIVLVADQFEELFTLTQDDGQRRAFIGRLLAEAQDRWVVITMRADFLGDCAPYRNLAEVLETKMQLIAPMTTAELRSAMEQQAGAVGLRFEADLANTILDDVKGEPGAMPLLQHALLELWKHRHGRWLVAEEYREKIGGVQKAIARTADAVYDELSPPRQERVRDIFVRLTRLDEETIRGEERRDTRRRVGLEELVPAGSDPAPTRALVAHLADARLVVTSVNDINGREEVEVAHEALIRHWPRLGRWLDEDRSNIRLRESIGQAAHEWEAGSGEDESLLVHRGGRLEDAEKLLAGRPDFLNPLETAYVKACVALREQEREQEKRRVEELTAERDRAEAAQVRASAEELFARAQRNEAFAARLDHAQEHEDRKEYAATIRARSAEFRAKAELLWSRAYELHRELRVGAGAPVRLATEERSHPAIFTLEVLHAGHGGGLLVHYGEPSSPRFVLVDGGDRSTFMRRLEPRLEKLRQRWGARGMVPLDLVMASHYDADAIEGVFRLLQAIADDPVPRFQIDGLWYNNFLPILPSQVLKEFTGGFKHEIPRLARELGIPLNEPFDSFVMPATIGPAQWTTPHGLTITILGPPVERIERWWEVWRSEQRERGSNIPSLVVHAGSWDEGDTLLRERLSEFASSPDLSLVRRPPGAVRLEPASGPRDRSPNNLASIIAHLEYGGRTALLTGDGLDSDIVSGLFDAWLLDPDDSLHVDLLKLPHFGSPRNVSCSFFERVTADHYLIVGNSRFNLPRPETLEMIITARGASRYTIHVAIAGKENTVSERIQQFFQHHAVRGRSINIEIHDTDETNLLIDLLDAVDY